MRSLPKLVVALSAAALAARTAGAFLSPSFASAGSSSAASSSAASGTTTSTPPPPRRRAPRSFWSGFRSALGVASSPAETTAAPPASSSVAGRSSSPPTWEELSESLSGASSAEDDDPPAPVVTLYRDTNGWCPFCERVWIALRAKGVPHAEQLINLQDKPDWYKALVPTTLVPAVLFHGGGGAGDDGGGGAERKNERRIVWESMDIMKALDEEFPDAPRMVLDTPEFEDALAMNDDLTAAGFAFAYGNRNGTLSDEEKEERRVKFMSELDRLDGALLSGGPFRLGDTFTGIDAIIAPTLERWRYQLPITADVDILDGRAGIAKWFEAMESFGPYADRAMGDEYSWTATNSMFLRFFGGGRGQAGGRGRHQARGRGGGEAHGGILGRSGGGDGGGGREVREGGGGEADIEPRGGGEGLHPVRPRLAEAPAPGDGCGEVGQRGSAPRRGCPALVLRAGRQQQRRVVTDGGGVDLAGAGTSN